MAFLSPSSPELVGESNLMPEGYRSRHEAIRRVSSRAGLVVGLLVLFASVTVYGGVLFYVSGLRSQLSDVELGIEAIVIDRNEAEEQRILVLERQLRSADQLVNNHQYMSVLLNHIEDLIHPSVRLDSFGVQTNTELGGIDVSMDMIGPSYRILAEQLVSFQSSPLVISITMNEFSLAETGDVRGQGVLHMDVAAIAAEQGMFDEQKGLDDVEESDDVEEGINL